MNRYLPDPTKSRSEYTMTPPRENNPDDRFDQALSERLRTLSMMPVDLGNLKRFVEEQIGPPPAAERRLELRTVSWWQRGVTRAAAASLLIGTVVLALVLNGSSGPVLASAERLAEIHGEVVPGGGHAAHVDSIHAANKALAKEKPGAPLLPDVQASRVMTCCVHSLGRKTLSCASVEADGTRVTIAAADAKDVTIPKGETVEVSGVTYHVQRQGDLNMVMTSREGRWVCLMGKVPVEKLIEMARSTRP